MKVYLNKRDGSVKAEGSYDEATGKLVVLKGSIVSPDVKHTEKFKGVRTIETRRKEHVENRTVKENVEFKSASTAANFVTGSSTNGLIAWKNKEGKNLKEGSVNKSEPVEKSL